MRSNCTMRRDDVRYTGAKEANRNDPGTRSNKKSITDRRKER
jgi:hypothetical protein